MTMRTAFAGSVIWLSLLAHVGAQGSPRLELKVDSRPVREATAVPVVSYADGLEVAQKAVVSVVMSKSVRKFGNGTKSSQKEDSLGSGVIITSDGYILSNHHVIADADVLDVTLPDGRVFPAKLVGTDPKTEVAVIKVEATQLPVVSVADSDQLRVGDLVFAIGYPMNVGQTVSMGIVSAKGRRVGLLQEIGGYENFIQTDAAINQGNSGGALVDAAGRLVGINTAILSGGGRGSIGIGFAIPINFARSIMASLIESGKVTRGYMGVAVDPLTAELAETLGLTRDTRGVIVADVTAGGPAERAGLQRYDVILTIAEKPVVSTQELRLVVSQLAPESSVPVRLVRDGHELSVTVRLGRAAEIQASNELITGVKVKPLEAAKRTELGLDGQEGGLLVVSVSADSPYASKLTTDMVILEINRTVVSDATQAAGLLVSGRNLLMVFSGGTVRPIALTIKATR